MRFILRRNLVVTATQRVWLDPRIPRWMFCRAWLGFARRVRPLPCAPVALSGFRMCSSEAADTDVLVTAARQVEAALISAGPVGATSISLRDLPRHLSDDVLDDLAVGLPEMLAAANSERVNQFLTRPQAPTPSLFYVDGGNVLLASKRQVRAILMAATHCSDGEALTELLQRRDKCARSGRQGGDGAPRKLTPVVVPSVTGPATAPKSPQRTSEQVERQRRLDALLAALPRYHVPLSAAAEWWKECEEPLGYLTAEELAVRAGGDDDLHRRFREVALEHAEAIDLVGPWATPPLDTSQSANEFVAILPPFHKNALCGDTEIALSKWKVADHDVFRLSRYLSTSHYTTVASLKGAPARVLEKELLHVVFSNPLLFQYRPPPPPVPAAAEDTTAASSGIALDADGTTVANVSVLFFQDPAVTGLPNLLPATPNMTADELDPTAEVNTVVDQSLGSVRFILSEHELNATMGGVPADVENLNLHDLLELLRMLTLCRKEGNDARFEAMRRFGLRKPVPKGPGLAGYKHKVIRAILRQRFPRGTVFMDRHVLSYFIFDALPLNSGVDVLKFRQSHLPEDGRTVHPISSDYICGNRHLWQPHQKANNDWVIWRADSPDLPSADDPSRYSEEDVVQIALSCAPGGDAFDPQRKTSYSTVTSRMPEVVRQWVRNFGGMPKLMARHPQYFNIVDEEYFTWQYFRDSKKPASKEPPPAAAEQPAPQVNE
jgi:hypothetical protein